MKQKKQTNEQYLWEHYYTEEELNIKISELSAYDYMMKDTKEYGNEYVFNYFGRKMTYKTFWDYIDKCAKSLKTLGAKEKDVITICMPNTPEAVISFFAINKIGAIANMVHPLSAEEEIKEYLQKTSSTLLIALNQCYAKIKNIIKETKVKNVIICSPSDSMPILLNTMYNVTLGRKTETPPKSSFYLFWKDFIKLSNSYYGNINAKVNKDDVAVILHSGGTTGTPKSIVLANRCITGVNEQAKVFFAGVEVGEVLLSILPVFHCFGLVVGVYIPICRGAVTVLIPQFDAKRFDKLMVKYKPEYIIGVPTLFEALVRNKYMENVDLSQLKCLVSGGDTLSPQRNQAINDFLKEHNSKGQIIQGYGMTETCGPVCFGTKGSNKLGSVGIPFPGNVMKICDPETYKEMKPNEIGEICINSFVLMDGYLDNPQETEEVLKLHDDGKKYIHTGDLGYMDEDGVFFYVQRIKRIIISSGYNVYPEYVEKVLKDNKYIKDACVVGVPHPYKKEIAKAFIMLNDGVEESYTVKKEIMDYTNKKLAHYMIPKEYIFKKEFPKTKMAKTDYRALQEELLNKNNKMKK